MHTPAAATRIQDPGPRALAPLPTVDQLPLFPEHYAAPKQSRPMAIERLTQEDMLATFGAVMDPGPRHSYTFTCDMIAQAGPLNLIAEFVRGLTPIQIARLYGLDTMNFALWLERLPPDMKATRAIAEKTYAEHAEMVLARRQPASKAEAEHVKTTLAVLAERHNRASLAAIGIVPVETKDKLEFHIHMAPPVPPATSASARDGSNTIDITPTPASALDAYFDPSIFTTPYNPHAPPVPSPDPGPDTAPAPGLAVDHPNAQDDHMYAQLPQPALPVEQMLRQLDGGEDWFDDDVE